MAINSKIIISFQPKQLDLQLSAFFNLLCKRISPGEPTQAVVYLHISATRERLVVFNQIDPIDVVVCVFSYIYIEAITKMREEFVTDHSQSPQRV